MSLESSVKLYSMIQDLNVLAEKAVDKINVLEAKIESLIKDNEHLKEVNAMLQRENKLLTDIIRDNARQQLLKPDPSMPYGPGPNGYNTNKCPKCGIQLNSVMGYVCPAGDCPTGLGGSHC